LILCDAVSIDIGYACANTAWVLYFKLAGTNEFMYFRIMWQF